MAKQSIPTQEENLISKTGNPETQKRKRETYLTTYIFKYLGKVKVKRKKVD